MLFLKFYIFFVGYKGHSCEIGPTTTSTTTTTTTPIPCSPRDDCYMHYTCGPQGQKVCLQGWTGVNCDMKIPGGFAECDNFQCKFVT